MRKYKNTMQVIREVLSEHPKGLGVMMLHILVSKRWSASSDNVKVLVCNMRAKGELKVSHSECECCGRKLTLYKFP